MEATMNWIDWAKENTDSDKASEKPEVLDGICVLDLSHESFAGLFASSLLAEFGAKVIRVEPLGGDIVRKMSPFAKYVHGTGLPYLVEARNKEHITLNLKNPRGKEILKALAQKSDVLIETFTPGTMDEGGIGWKALKQVNPRLIYAAVNSYGQIGELSGIARVSRWRCYDIIAQALSGFVSTTGIPENFTEFPEHAKVPTKMGNWMGWYAGGAFAALAVMTALYYREISGEGQLIDISPAEALMSLNNYALQFYHLTGEVMQRPANMEPAAHPYCYVRCRDGMMFLAGCTDANWRALCSIIGRDDLADKYPTVKDRTDPENVLDIVREIEKFTMERTRSELVDIWLSYKGPGVTVAGEVLAPDETMKLNHWYERKALVKIKEDPWGEILMQGIPVKMSETPPRIKWACREVGADNEAVYLDFLGLDKQEYEQLKEEGAI
jgi:crotonobetainyl-CoA:carnitine CoA-transferase CaiB-like acyl-CoA transferase